MPEGDWDQGQRTGIFWTSFHVSPELKEDKSALTEFVKAARVDLIEQIAQRIKKSMMDGRSYSVRNKEIGFHNVTTYFIVCAILLDNPGDCEIGEYTVAPGKEGEYREYTMLAIGNYWKRIA